MEKYRTSEDKLWGAMIGECECVGCDRTDTESVKVGKVTLRLCSLHIAEKDT